MMISVEQINSDPYTSIILNNILITPMFPDFKGLSDRKKIQNLTFVHFRTVQSQFSNFNKALVFPKIQVHIFFNSQDQELRGKR